jgi:hypothetical protein
MTILYGFLVVRNEHHRRDASLFSIAVQFPKLDVAGSIPVSRSCFQSAGLTPFLPVPLISNTFEDNLMPAAERPLPVGLLSQAVLCELDPARFSE